MAAYPDTNYTVIDGENLDDHALDVPSKVVLTDTRAGGQSQVVATFQHYGDAVMFAAMKNRAPEVRSDYSTLPDGTEGGCLVVVETDEVIARFTGKDCDDALISWLMRVYPHYAATHSLTKDTP